MKKKENHIIYFMALFLVLNLLNTYFLTTNTLNQYIIPFQRTFVSEISSIIGNLGVLIILVVLGVLFYKKQRHQMKYMIVVTLVLNFCIYALGYHTKNFKVMFSIYNFQLLRNPAAGFATNVVFDWISELFVYWRIVTFIPSITLFVYYRRVRKVVFHDNFEVFPIRKILATILGCGMCLGSLNIFTISLEKNWPYTTEIPLYGCEYAGVYNYYISEILFKVDYRDALYRKESIAGAADKLDTFDKNKNRYVNFLDGKSYSNQDFQSGIFAGKNLFVIQLESVQSYVFNQSFNNNEVTPYFNQLFKDENVFYFPNVYSAAGIGNTSDAEFAFMTGLMPTGDMTINWEFYDRDFLIPGLGYNFGDTYIKYSYNPTTETFYNHKNVHEEMYGLDLFRGSNTFMKEFPYEENRELYLNSWVSDEAILKWAAGHAKEGLTTHDNFMTFLLNITPHTPFLDLSSEYPEEKNFEKIDWIKEEKESKMESYLNQIHYNDKMIYEFLMDVTNKESENYLEDTVFVLYGDHGNALTRNEYEILFGRALTDFEYRKILIQIPIIVFDPSGSLATSVRSSGFTKESICSTVKSQRDLNRTIVNLFGLTSKNQLFGVNIFSGEPSFAYDPKNVDLFTDFFTYSVKNNQYESYSNVHDNFQIIEQIKQYKYYQDIYINLIVNQAEERY